jgi:tRNA-dihydrouridine synthase
MIGRAAIGNPWIFSRLDRHQVTPEQVQAVMDCHLERMLAFHGEERGMILFRKHASRYLSVFSLEPPLRQKLLTTPSPVEFKEIIHQIL